MAAINIENRLIAMLDVLGFSNQLANESDLSAIASRYSSIILKAKESSFSPKAAPGSPESPPSNFALGEFAFDTIVLVSEEISPESVGKFIFATTHLMEMFFEEKFPLRGAISIGNYYSDEHSGIFLSNIFKRLNTIGQNQEWCGCIVLPEAEQVVLENMIGPGPYRNNDQGATAIRYPIPIKKGQPELGELLCLNWAYFLSDASRAAGLSFLAENEVKYMNTNRFLEFLSSLPESAQRLPEEFFPATRVKFMKARSAVRVKFEDEIGNGIDPKCSFTFAAYEPVA